MPIYEYECQSCGQRFEALVRGSSKSACPSCQGTELTRVLSVFAVGSRSSARHPRAEVGACGTCGDPRGPGACSIN